MSLDSLLEDGWRRADSQIEPSESPKKNPAQSAANAASVIDADSFKPYCKRLTRKFDEDIFRALCEYAVTRGYTSRQKLRELFSDRLPDKLDKAPDKWPLPNPVVCRKILDFLGDINTPPTGSTRPWRHAQGDTDRASTTLPNGPRRASTGRHHAYA